MTTVVINAQADVEDTHIRANAATTNYYADTVIYVGESNAASSVRRSLMKFAVPSEAGATVSSATLTLYALQDLTDNARNLNLYQLTRNWVEAEVTWNIYSTGNNWATAGAMGAGDYNSTVLGTLNIGVDPLGTPTKTITINASGIAVVQGWMRGTTSNYGILAAMSTENADCTGYASSKYATESQRPKLTIEYTVSGGGQFILWSSA